MNKNINFCIVILSFVVLFFVLSVTNIDAQQALPKQSLSIDPFITDLQLTPGHTTTYALTVTNLSTKPLGIHADITGLVEPDDKSIPDTTISSSPMIGWTTLSQTDMVIDPKGKKVIQVSITPPTNAQDGGYYATIFITPIVSNQQLPEQPILLSRIGTLIFATIGNLNYNDLVRKVDVNLSPTQTIFETGNAELNLTVTNNYFTHFTAKPQITITPLFFGKTQIIFPEEKHILPGKTKEWNIPVQMQSLSVIYKVHALVSVGQGKQVLAETYIIILPYKQLLIVFAVFLLFLTIVYKWKNIRAALYVLLKGK